MRIDPVQVAAASTQAELAAMHRDSSVRQKPAEAAVPEHASPPVSVPARPPTQISVMMDQDKNIIYQFLDARTGEVVQQVPPEQVLQVMRSIAETLRQAEQKLEITI